MNYYYLPTCLDAGKFPENIPLNISTTLFFAHARVQLTNKLYDMHN